LSAEFAAGRTGADTGGGFREHGVIGNPDFAARDTRTERKSAQRTIAAAAKRVAFAICPCNKIRYQLIVGSTYALNHAQVFEPPEI